MTACTKRTHARKHAQAQAETHARTHTHTKGKHTEGTTKATETETPTMSWVLLANHPNDNLQITQNMGNDWHIPTNLKFNGHSALPKSIKEIEGTHRNEYKSLL
jgi:hypothetical protein